MIKEERLLRIGVLGCGPISQAAHFEACRRGRNTELYAICDISQELADAMATLHSPRKVYYNYDDMLADPLVEAVIIGIADQFHVPMAAKALAAGKHVLVEKPLGVTVEECLELERQAEESGLLLQVGHMKRFDPGIAYARKFIREEMGQMLALKAWYCDSTYRYTVTDNVMPLPVTGSGALKPQGHPKEDKQRYYMLTHGSHLLDTARYLGGEILAVQARHVQKYGAHCWFTAVEFADGSMGHLDLTVAVRMDWHEGFQIYGEHGSVTGKTYNPWLFKSSDVEVFSAKDGVTRRPLGADAHFYKLQTEGFADSILHGVPLQGANIQDGIAVMRGMAAIARSVETGQRIVLADITGGV
ncbi:oxidoreductase [Bacillus sp. FJAT-27264]|uniref:Gfo/Idh/MocA family protein n=1 Tax=Paenibacillus sp. (strain DSM 101736 / FJAT-27264) TaxID=1850362 RepID=UPI000807CECB|nr:Gfo/Idh/MocA family oxidoreductase [Bacillus sp. FJAT-27264]OBZ09702.1 oxidoreductase [Bacillus sp. FJAT-27264]